MAVNPCVQRYDLVQPHIGLVTRETVTGPADVACLAANVCCLMT